MAGTSFPICPDCPTLRAAPTERGFSRRRPRFSRIRETVPRFDNAAANRLRYCTAILRGSRRAALRRRTACRTPNWTNLPAMSIAASASSATCNISFITPAASSGSGPSGRARIHARALPERESPQIAAARSCSAREPTARSNRVRELWPLKSKCGCTTMRRNRWSPRLGKPSASDGACFATKQAATFPTQPAFSPAEPQKAEHLGRSSRVATPAANHQQQSVFGGDRRPAGNRFTKAARREGQNMLVALQSGCLSKRQAGMCCRGAGHGGRNIAPRMSGTEQQQRHDDDPPNAARNQPLDPLGDRRLSELEETRLQRHSSLARQSDPPRRRIRPHPAASRVPCPTSNRPARSSSRSTRLGNGRHGVELVRNEDAGRVGSPCHCLPAATDADAL